MVKTLYEWKLLKENKLVPRNLDGRAEKLRQQNLKLLQQEVIEGELVINNLWDFGQDQAKIKTINGNVYVDGTNGKIPQWLKNVTVNGDFYCGHNKLMSLEGCPTIVKGYFDCSNNRLTSLENCPTIVNGSFNCSSNQLTSLEGCPTIVDYNFNCSNNPTKFTEKDIPKSTKIKCKIYF